MSSLQYNPDESSHLALIGEDIRELLVQGFDLPEESKIVRDTSMARIPWRPAIEAADRGLNTTTTLKPPYVVWSMMTPEEQDDEMVPADVSAWNIPILVYYIADRREVAKTTIIEARAGDIHAVGSTNYMFPGQALYFDEIDEYARVQAVLSSSEFTIDTGLSTTVGQAVYSDISSDLDIRCERAKKLFPMGAALRACRVVSTPQASINIDLEPNAAFYENNQQAVAGMITFTVQYATLNRYGQAEYVV